MRHEQTGSADAPKQRQQALSPPKRRAEFRFYQELNDFLPQRRRRRSFTVEFAENTAVKDVIEAIGAPHPEIDLILINGLSAAFDHRLRGGERVSVYPAFQRLNIAPLCRLRPEPSGKPRFILDAHLGRLARYLRLAGFDTLYRNDYDDNAIAMIANREGRVVLTRDLGLLKRRAVTRGHWLRAIKPRRQIEEVVSVFELRRILKPFTRCMSCNGVLRAAPKEAVRRRAPPWAPERYDQFAQCAGCEKIYWPGSHYDRMRALIERLRQHVD